MDFTTILKESLKRKLILPEKITKHSILLYSTVILIFSLGFLVRLFPFFRFDPLLRAYDPWYQLTVTKYIAANGYASFFEWYDTKSWYPYGRNIAESTYPGTPFTAATLYFILRAFGVRTDAYMVCYIFPAFMGALTCVALYLLGVELKNHTVGLLSGFFLVFCPAHISRTTVGFFDNEALGVLLTVLTFYFFIRTIKEDHDPIINGILSGLSLGYIGASWGAYLYILDLIPLVVVGLLIFRRFSYRLVLGYTLTTLIGLLIIIRVPRTSSNFLTSTSGMIPLLVLGLVLIIGVITWLKEFFPELNMRLVIIRSIPLIIAGTSVALYYLYKTERIKWISGKFLAVINPSDRSAIISSVAEHIPIAWGQLFFNFYLVIILMPAGLYFCIKRLDDIDIAVVIFGLTALYFAASMVRLVLILSVPACLLASFAIVTFMKPFSKALASKQYSFTSTPSFIAILKGKKAKRINFIPKDSALLVVVFVLSILVLNTWWGTRVAYDYFSTPDMILRGRTQEGDAIQFQDWQESMMYLREMTPQDSIVASWWDYGYIIRAVGNRTTVIDNATTNSTQIAWIGCALMSPPEEAVKILKRYDINYVLVHFTGAIGSGGGDEGKFVWMVRIAEENLNGTIKESDYIDENLGAPKQPYYDSLLYTLMYYQYWDTPEEHPVQDTTAHFEHVYTTQYWLVRIYKVHY